MSVTLYDWPARLRSRVYQRFVDSQWAIPTANAIGAGAMQLQASFVALLSLFSIDPVTSDPTSPAYGVGRGVQLDRLGRIVGMVRGGINDDHFRFYLRGKIRANKSNGSVSAIIAVFLAMFPGSTPVYLPGGIASFTLRIDGYPITDAPTVTAALFMLDLAKQAGITTVFEWDTAVDNNFVLDGTPGQGFPIDSVVGSGGVLGGAV